ncbi:MAG: hypothetical protein ACM3QV_00200 [Caulobacteraceae bacterium]
MDEKGGKTIQYKTSIAQNISYIDEYIRGFEIYSAKDEQALMEISNMINGVVTRISEIDAAQKKRIALTNEIMKTLEELETSYKKFAESRKSSRQEII